MKEHNVEAAQSEVMRRDYADSRRRKWLSELARLGVVEYSRRFRGRSGTPGNSGLSVWAWNGGRELEFLQWRRRAKWLIYGGGSSEVLK